MAAAQLRIFSDRNAVDSHGARDVLDLPLAQILEDKGQTVAHVIINGVRDEYPTGIGQGFDPRRDVDAVAVNIVARDDDIGEVDPDPKIEPLADRDTRVALRHAALHLDCAARRIDDTRKFRQYAVTGGLDDSAAVFGDFGIDKGAAVRHQSFECSLLVPTHQPRISRYIGGEDGG